MLALALLRNCGAVAVEPKAVIKARDTYPYGASILIDGRGSVSDRPLRWKLKGSNAPFETAADDKKRENVYFKMISPEPGEYTVQLVARGIPEGGKPEDIDADIDEVKFKVLQTSPLPTPPPTPPPGPGPPGPLPPGPAPGPRPAAGTPAAIGYDYADTLLPAFAVSLEGAASGTWDNTGQLSQLGRDRLTAELQRAWAPVAAEMTRRFGPSSDVSTPDANKQLIKAFITEVASGIRFRGTK